MKWYEKYCHAFHISINHRNDFCGIIWNKQIRQIFAKEENNHTCNNGIGNSYNMRTVKSLSDSVQFTRSYILCIICCHCCSDCNICLGKNILNLISCRKCRYCIGTKNIQRRLYHHGSDRSDGILQSHGNAHKNFFFGNLWTKSPVICLQSQFRYVFYDINQAKHSGYSLCCDRCPGSPGDSHMENNNKRQVKYYIQKCRQNQEIQGCLTVSQCSQNTGQDII